MTPDSAQESPRRAGDSKGPCDAVNGQSDLLADTQSDGGTAIVDLRTLRLEEILPPRDGPVADAVSFLPGGRTFVNGGSNGRVTLWNLSTRRIARTLRFPGAIQLTAPGPDGRLLAVQAQAGRSRNSHVEVVEIVTGKVLQTHTVPDGSGGLAFSADGRELVAVGCCEPGSTVVAWDARSGRQLFSRSLPGHAQPMAIAPDSRTVGIGTQDGKVLFLNPRSGKPVQPPLQAAAGNIDYVSFSADGRSLAVGAADNAVSVWDLRSRKRLGNPFGPYPGTIPATLFEPNGRLLIVLLENAIEWPTDVRTWERFACQAAGRNLTHAEWADLLPNRPYRRVCPG